MRPRLITSLALAASACVFATGASAQSVIIEDNFDDGNLATHTDTNGGFSSFNNIGSAPTASVTEVATPTGVASLAHTSGNQWSKMGIYGMNAVSGGLYESITATIEVDQFTFLNSIGSDFANDLFSAGLGNLHFGMQPFIGDWEFGIGYGPHHQLDTAQFDTTLASGNFNNTQLAQFFEPFTISFTGDRSGWSFVIATSTGTAFTDQDGTVTATGTWTPSQFLEAFTDFDTSANPTNPSLSDSGAPFFIEIMKRKGSPETLLVDSVIASGVVDVSDPVLVSTDPVDTATNVPVNQNLLMTFDENVVKGSSGDIRLVKSGTVVETFTPTAANVTISDNVVSIDPTSLLDVNTTYYLEVDGGALEDVNGLTYDGFSGSGTWSFTTGTPGPDAVGNVSVFTAAMAGEAIGTGRFDHVFDTQTDLNASHLLVSGSAIAMSAGHHLVLYNSRFDSTGGNERSEVQSNLNLDGADLAAGWSQGYIRRDNGQNETITAGGAIIDVANDDDILQLESFRTDTNAAGVERAAGNTGIQLVKLDDTWDYLSLAGTATVGDYQSIPNSTTTSTAVVYSEVIEKDAGSFEYAAGTGVTLKQQGHYLVLANTYASGAPDRTAIIQWLTLDGTEVDGSKTTVYCRGSGSQSCEEGAVAIGMIIETTAANQVLNVRILQDVGQAGMTVVGERTGLTIAKLPDGADYVRLKDTSADQDLNPASATALDFDDPGSQLEVDSPFTHSTTTSTTTTPSRIGVTTGGDYLFLAAQFSADDTVERGFYNLGWQTNGSGGIAAHGQTGRFSRNTGGADQFGNWAGFVTSLKADDYIETLTQALGNGGTNLADVLALQGVSLDSLFGAAPDPYYDWANDYVTLTDTDPTLDFDKGGLPTGIEWVLDGDPTDGSDDGGIAPTGTPTAGGGLVFVFRRSDAANDDSNTAISVDYGSNLDGWTAANPPGDGTTMVEEDDYYGTGVDRVTVTIPGSKAANGRLFARLRVDITL